jgi:hypothetical protein
VSGTQSAFESHDKFLRDRYLNPAQPAEVGIEDDVAEQRRRSLRCALGEAQLALAEFEKKHDVKAVEAELADVDRLAGACPANADASHPAHLKC